MAPWAIAEMSESCDWNAVVTFLLRPPSSKSGVVEAGYRLGSERGSPNHGSTLASKRVKPQIWPPARVST